jgi:hypothetical protein
MTDATLFSVNKLVGSEAYDELPHSPQNGSRKSRS